MAERTGWLYALVTVPGFYRVFQDTLGGERARAEFGRLYFTEFADKHVLEVGCGPGTWVSEMSAVQSYTGVDWNAAHIAKARSRFNTSQYAFFCGDVSESGALPDQRFDVICAFGLLHHLDDLQARNLLEAVKAKLVSGGKFLAIEPVYHEGQHWFARFMKNRDSGQNIRTESGYRELLDGQFAETSTQLHTDMLRVPYSHCVLQATDHD